MVSVVSGDRHTCSIAINEATCSPASDGFACRLVPGLTQDVSRVFGVFLTCVRSSF